MKFLVLLCLVYSALGANNSDSDDIDPKLIHEIAVNITKLQHQALNWTYPTNNYYYLSENARPGDYKYDGEFDFIIIGAGSAGGVLANRLTEVEGWNTLLLEGGAVEDNITDIPDLTDYLRTTTYNWGYFIEPQGENLAGYIDHRFPFPRGKGLGGTSIINAMIYARGNAEDFDEWGKENPGWSYKEILPYFIKSEIVAFPNYTRGYHGTNGSLYVEWSRIYDELGEAFLKAQTELGRKVVYDYNGAPEDQLSFGICQLTERLGMRDSVGKSFILPILDRPNLIVYKKTLVTKLIIESNTVIGVEYVRDGTFHYAIAKKEVILSAGAVQTPQLLMLSGIGPRKQLESFGIPVIKDLPVGENLWDHPIYNYQSFAINKSYSYPPLEEAVREYLHAQGPLTTADDLQVIGYVNFYDKSSNVPDVEHVLHVGRVGNTPYEVYKNLFGFTRETYDTVLQPRVNISQISIHSVLLHPLSRGTIKLKSASPFEFPLLDPNYFSNPRDVKVLVDALKDQIVMANTTALQKYNTTIIKVVHPLCNHTVYGSDEYWDCMVRTVITTVYHFSGSAQMGPESRNDTVTNHLLQVHGIKNLRVVDTSVVPVTTSGHTSAVGNMIGEKAGDIIKEQYCDNVICNYI